MSVRSRLGAVRRHLLCTFCSRRVPLGQHGPVVSFTFDDFPRTAYTVGGSILKGYGARGTYYVAIGLMNTENDLGEQFRLEDLHSLVQDGHELASHTFNHVSCSRVPLATFRQSVEKGRKAIREAAGLADSGNFAFPYGAVTLNAKKTLGLQMNSCRGTCGGLNGPDLDLNLLRANRLYGDLDKSPEVERLILQNERQKGWLIFYSHDIRPQPSRFGCTPALLEAVVAFAARRGSRMLTVAEVLAEVRSQ